MAPATHMFCSHVHVGLGTDKLVCVVYIVISLQNEWGRQWNGYWKHRGRCCNTDWGKFGLVNSLFGLMNISWLTKKQYHEKCCANSNGRHIGGLISLSTSEFCPWILFFIRQHCVVFHLVKSSECFAIHFRRIRCSTVRMNYRPIT